MYSNQHENPLEGPVMVSSTVSVGLNCRSTGSFKGEICAQLPVF